MLQQKLSSICIAAIFQILVHSAALIIMIPGQRSLLKLGNRTEEPHLRDDDADRRLDVMGVLTIRDNAQR